MRGGRKAEKTKTTVNKYWKDFVWAQKRARARAFTQNPAKRHYEARPGKVRRKEIWKTSSKLVESERASESTLWGSECDDDIASSNGKHTRLTHISNRCSGVCVLTCLLREWTSSTLRPRPLPLPRQNSEHSPNECDVNERRCDKSNCVRLHLIVIFKWNAFQTSCPCTREEFSSLIFFSSLFCCFFHFCMARSSSRYFFFRSPFSDALCANKKR